MASPETLFVVGPIGSGCSTVLNYMAGERYAGDLVVPPIVTTGDINDLHDPRRQNQISKVQFDNMEASGLFSVVWARPKVDIYKHVVRHAFSYIPESDQRLRVYGTNNSMFKSGVKSVEDFADSGEVLLVNASWETRQARLMKWLGSEVMVDRLMKWHEHNDDRFAMGYRPIRGVIDTSFQDDPAFAEQRAQEFLAEQYQIMPTE